MKRTLTPRDAYAEASSAFDHGVFPARDGWVYGFDQRYLRDVDPAAVDG